MRRLVVSMVVVACSAPAPKPVIESPAPPQPSPIAAADPPPPALRLPGDVVPVRERVELTIDPTQKSAVGAIHIDATVKKPTRVVWINGTDLGVHAATLAGKPARVIGSGEFVGLVAEAELEPGPLEIAAQFTAPIEPEKARGLYAVSENGEAYAYTFFEPIDSRRAFPSFDEPNYKIPWTLVFHVRKTDVALGNARVVKESDEPKGYKRVELAETRPLPSYLVAFVVGPFEVIDDGVAGRANTPVRFIITKGHAAELRFAKEVTPRIIKALEDYFDMPYPFGKLDVAVVPRSWGTMEHPGIVALGQPLTLIPPDAETRAREENYTNIASHELGHYWFGDLVTTAWWDDIWLNEAMGEWLDMITTDAVMPAWHFRETRVDITARALGADETLSVQPIRRPVTSRDGIETSFDNDTTYYKGSSVARAAEAFVGPGKWQAFIRGYIRKHVDGNATEPDFVAELRAALGDEVATAFELYITRPGAPLVRVSCQSDHIQIARARALPLGVADPAPAQTWPVPVCMRFGDAAHAQRACTTGDALPVASCPTWIIPNDGATGYYRSVVDPKMVAALLDPRSKLVAIAKPTSAEKRNLVADLRAMVARNELQLDQLLALVPALLADRDPLVQFATFPASAVRASGLDDATYAGWRAWQGKTFGPLARKLGWHRGKADSDDLEHLRESLMFDVGDEDPVLAREATQIADRWLAGDRRIDDWLANAALFVSAKHGDAARFDRYVAAAKAATDVDARQRILQVLAVFEDPALAARALEIVRGTEFDIRDTLRILYWSFGRRETRDIVLPFLAAHFDEIIPRLLETEKSNLLANLAGAYCDAPHRDAAAAIATPYSQTIGKEMTKRALERSGECIAELARERPAIERIVKK